MVPSDTRQLGGEAAGTITDIGAGVTDYTIGDPVMGLVTGTGPITDTDQRLITHIPPGWTYPQAASIPVVFLTAYYGLTDLAHAQPGHKLLLHSAAGGVGMATIQLARHLELDLYATAHPSKWDTLRALGIPDDHIASSRTNEFEKKFRHTTNGHGFDIILNSLAGELTDASLRLLAPHGHFLELGKTDIRDPNTLNPNTHYKAYDLMDAGPEHIHHMLQQLHHLFETGELHPLPTTTWPIHHTPNAFRYLSQARHTGKITLTLPTPLDPNGTVLITGGTGTLGAHTARHLITHHGIRHLHLISRQGPNAPGATELHTELTNLGATTTITACDTTNPQHLTQTLNTINPQHPLTAIIHTAGTLHDATIENLTPQQLHTVLQPKIDAAWNLHQLTLNHPLTHFILYSSATGTLGNPGQANYAAANTFLDALAHHRHNQGLPATSLAWGYWQDTSNLTNKLQTTHINRITRTGITPLPTTEGLTLLDTTLTNHHTTTLPIKLNLHTLHQQATNGTLQPLLRTLTTTPKTKPTPTPNLTQQLTNHPPTEHHNIILNHIRTQTATILGHTHPDNINPNHTFKDIGFDSLTAIELRNRLNNTTGLKLPATLIFDHPTPTHLTQHIHSELELDSAQDSGRRVLRGRSEAAKGLAALSPWTRLRSSRLG